ncbi:acylphosphatase [Rubrivirga sp. IMCC45206]|uniref:acylphosphatase n=1 Tax=Rubrivirga sp. IMCC45206 TaxID=3391614 RepID=UPI00398F9DA6
MQRLEATVRGRVQGVGFRRYVMRWARRLGLSGWVRNDPDGTVRLAADGEAPELDRLTRLLWGGPPGADVQAVEAVRTAPLARFDDFRIRRP